MTQIDLDKLRGRWAESGHRIDAELELDLDAVRALLVKRTRRAFRRHSRWLAATSVLAGAVSLALLAFIVSHWGQWLYVLLATLILPLAAAFAVVDLQQLRALSRLSFDHPTTRLRAHLDALQARQVALVKWEFLLAVLLWFPVLIVPLKGVFGIDLLRALPASVIWVNLALGVVFIPVAMLVAGWMSRRWHGTSAMQRLLMDMAGRSWAKARAEYDLLESGAIVPISPELDAQVRALRRRLLVTVWLFAGLLVGFGLFNLSHGGHPHLIVAGVAMILAIVPQMVCAGQHRQALDNFGDDERQLRQRIDAVLSLRLVIARATLIALPALTLPLSLVLTKLALGIDLLQMLTLAGLAVWLLVGLIASAAVAAWLRRAPAALEWAANLISLDTIRRTKSLLPPAQT